MKKQSFKDSMSKSLVQEDQHIKSRFDKAELIFSDNPKPAEQQPSRQETPAHVPTKEAISTRSKKERVVRDTFSMPMSDYALINEVKMRCLLLGIDTSRSEVVRAAVKYLSNIKEDVLREVLSGMTKLKPGPTKESL